MARKDQLSSNKDRCDICGSSLDDDAVIQEFPDGSVVRLCADCAVAAPPEDELLEDEDLESDDATVEYAGPTEDHGPAEQFDGSEPRRFSADDFDDDDSDDQDLDDDDDSVEVKAAAELAAWANNPSLGAEATDEDLELDEEYDEQEAQEAAMQLAAVIAEADGLEAPDVADTASFRTDTGEEQSDYEAEDEGFPTAIPAPPALPLPAQAPAAPEILGQTSDAGVPEKTRDLLVPITDLLGLQTEMQSALSRLSNTLEHFVSDMVLSEEKTSAITDRIQQLEDELESTRERLRVTEALLPDSDYHAVAAVAAATAARDVDLLSATPQVEDEEQADQGLTTFPPSLPPLPAAAPAIAAPAIGMPAIGAPAPPPLPGLPAMALPPLVPPPMGGAAPSVVAPPPPLPAKTPVTPSEFAALDEPAAPDMTPPPVVKQPLLPPQTPPARPAAPAAKAPAKPAGAPTLPGKAAATGALAAAGGATAAGGAAAAMTPTPLGALGQHAPHAVVGAAAAMSKLLRGRKGHNQMIPEPEPELEPEPEPQEPLGLTFSINEVQVAQRFFNESEFVKKVKEISRSIGKPKANVSRTSPGAAQATITVFWDIVWYQYLIDLRKELPPDEERVTLAQEGMDLEELEPRFRDKNATINDDGRLDASELEVNLLSDPEALITEMDDLPSPEERLADDATEEIWDQRTAPEFRWD